jgi:hypothetical protein
VLAGLTIDEDIVGLVVFGFVLLIVAEMEVEVVFVV